VNRLRCEDCGTVFYSAAAKTLVEQGVACAKCGGKLLLDDGKDGEDGKDMTPTGTVPGNGDGDDDS
jgi:DNA-directed RNA polymerase subunit RPC12/RpoP